MSINRDLIIKRFDRLDKLLEKLNEFKNISKEEFLSNTTINLSAQRALEISINICIDIGAHILSIKSNEKPETYSEIFQKLEEIKVINSKRKEVLVDMVKFRNILTHLYMEINNEIVYEIIQTKLNDFTFFKNDIYSKFKEELLGEY